MSSGEKRRKYSLPRSKRKYEAWIRRLQAYHACSMMWSMGIITECRCNMDGRKPLVKFWKCQYCLHKSFARMIPDVKFKF